MQLTENNHMLPRTSLSNVFHADSQKFNRVYKSELQSLYPPSILLSDASRDTYDVPDRKIYAVFFYLDQSEFTSHCMTDVFR